jgi:hypothetical protein
MAFLRINLPPRPLAGVYSRIVRRELGFRPFFQQSASESGLQTGLFARSLAVAVGQAFATGQFVRPEFALALRDRLRDYELKPPAKQYARLVEAINHSVALAEIVAGQRLAADDAGIEISDSAIASAAQADIYRFSTEPSISLFRDLPQGSLWSGTPAPTWWQEFPEAPDNWVTPISQLGEPLWASSHLTGDSLTYLLNFGLDRIDSKPELIQPWTQSVSSLVAAASRPRADIHEVVNCCRVDP